MNVSILTACQENTVHQRHLITHHVPITIIEHVNYFNFSEFELFAVHVKIYGENRKHL